MSEGVQFRQSISDQFGSLPSASNQSKLREEPQQPVQNSNQQQKQPGKIIIVPQPFQPNLVKDFNRSLQEQQAAAQIIQQDARVNQGSSQSINQNQIHQPPPSVPIPILQQTILMRECEKRLNTQTKVLIELFVEVLKVKEKYNNITLDTAKSNVEVLSLIYAIDCYKKKKVWLIKKHADQINIIEKELFQFWNIEKEPTYFKHIYNFFFGELSDYDLEGNIQIDPTLGNKILNSQLSNERIDDYLVCLIPMAESLKESDINYVKNNLARTPDYNYNNTIQSLIQHLKITLLRLFCILFKLYQNHVDFGYSIKYVQQMMAQGSVFKNIGI